MRFSATRLLLTLLLPAGVLSGTAHAQTALPAGSAHYTIYQGDKPVGSSDYTIQPQSAGVSITSHGKLTLSKFNYSFTNTQRLDTGLNLVDDQLTGDVNGSPVTFSAKSDSSGRQFQISISANGKQTQNSVDRHQHLVLLPDLDSAAYVLLTKLALQNPPSSWILIPKDTGLLIPSLYARAASVRGRLNNSQMDVQHTTVTVGSQNPITVELFYTSDGRCLEADLPEQNFFVVLDGFKLVNRPKEAPPQGSGPPPQNGQQQNGQPQPGQPQSGPPQYPAPQGGYPSPQQQ
jgi:hypothetical protein